MYELMAVFPVPLPLICALVMEHLYCLINGNATTEEWDIMGITEKLLLYRDDLLVYLADPQTSLEALRDTVDEFGG